MYRMMLYQQDISGPHIVYGILNTVIHSARYEYNYLVETVKVEIALLTCRVAQMEDPVVFIQISFFFQLVCHVKRIQH